MLGVPADNLKPASAWWTFASFGRPGVRFARQAVLAAYRHAAVLGVNQHVKVISVNSGVMVDGNYQVVDSDLAPIPGLFAVGTVGGDVCGNNDWRMSFDALSNGHCMTAGRYSVLYAIHGKAEPANPSLGMR